MPVVTAANLRKELAGSLLFDYIATYMYEDDTPAAERRMQALTLDRDLLRTIRGVVSPDYMAMGSRGMAEMGLMSTAIPESYGGAGFG